MKRALTALILVGCLALLICAPAQAMQYSSGTTNLWLVPDSGGSVDLTNGTTHLQDIKGYPFGLNYGNTLTTGIGTLVGTIEGPTPVTLKEGPVILTIERSQDASNGNIKIRWKINPAFIPPLTADTAVDIYFTTGNGSGEYGANPFVKLISKNDLVASPGLADVSVDETDKSFSVAHQVGVSYPELYFKGLKGDSDPAATGDYGLSGALAVAKLNLVLTKPYTFISLPVLPTDIDGLNNSMASVFGNQLVANEEVHRWGNAPTDQNYYWTTKAKDSGTDAWPTTAFNMNHLEGYFVHLNTDSAATRTISIVGKVMPSSEVRSVNLKYTSFGLPTPVQKASAAEAGFDDTVQSLPNLNDEIHRWDTANQSFIWSTYVGGTISWQDWATKFNKLYSGRGYFYYRKPDGGTPFNWKTIP